MTQSFFENSATAITDFTKELILRDYQEEVITNVYKFFGTGKKRVLVYAPTGAGKTVIASKIIGNYVKQGKRVLFLVHRGKLVKQTRSTLNKFFGIEPGIIWADYAKPDYTKSVQIAMLQTIQNRELPPDIDLIILDEAHTAAYYKVWRRILDTYAGFIWCLNQKVDFLGLSASPWRSKNKEGYCQFFDTIVKAPYPSQLIERGHLSRARQFGYTHLIDESKLQSSDGEFTQTSMAEVCDDEFNAELIKIYLDKTQEQWRKPIAFCATVKQAENLARQFLLHDIQAKCIIGDTSERERDVIFQEFSNGKTHLISSVGVLCEGFDEPSVNAILVCRPIKSRALWVQICGRGLRINEGKEDCWFFDFCGNIRRIGMPTRSFELKLCPNSKEDPPEETKTCPSCESEVNKFLAVCPYCGFEFSSEKPEAKRRKRKFEEVLTPEQKKQVNFLKTSAVNSFNKQTGFDGLENKFKHKYDYYPPPDWFDGLLFGHVDDNLMGWEESVQILWRYLLQTTPDTKENSKLNKHRIEREFKTAIKYTREILRTRYSGIDFKDEQRTELIKKEISEKLKYKPWWIILGHKQPLNLEYLKDAYRRAVGIKEILYPDPKQRKLKESILALLGIAYTEALSYHKQDEQLINKHIFFIRESLEKSNFQAIQNYISLLSFDIKTIVWQSLSQEERNKYQDWKRLKSQPKPKSPILNKVKSANSEVAEQKRHPALPLSQSLDEKKINPPIIKRSSKPTSQSEPKRGNETPDYKALNGLLFEIDTYSDSEAERDWSSAKYDPAWDDGSAFPSKQD
ncbi:putative helicase (plasmid) [Calothrix parasitica NIES-267]|uniref:Putative helicase n=1 Tax=Calothrix parasitica NIES-267 TaxID=1973488 RepID=A0A1Z4M2D3_9CYAN|nr:putative helicase [Calothrix parasitica NIES-267]